MGKRTWRVAATLLALALPAPACAAAELPNDPFFPGNGWQSRIGWTPPASDVGYPVIAIVDSGLRSGFDDFAGYLEAESADCTATSGEPRPIRHPSDVDDTSTDGHGTKVATLAAAPANGKGSVGVSPYSPLVVVRVTTPGGAFAPNGLKCAFNYLAGVAQGQPLVVNVSAEFDRAPPGAQAALDRLIGAGALVVAAAGNTRGGPVRWPANAQHVVAVGRDDGEGARGPKLDIVAPGAHLLLPQASGGWSSGDAGTSFSSPLVAGAAARIWGFVPVLEPQVITYLLRKNARKMANRYASGLVRIDASLAAAAKREPKIDESEPNNRKPDAQRKAGCTRTCTLNGLVTKSDDDSDYWHLLRRTRCPRKLKATGGVSAICIKGSGGVYIRVRPKLALGLYKVTVPRR